MKEERKMLVPPGYTHIPLAWGDLHPEPIFDVGNAMIGATIDDYMVFGEAAVYAAKSAKFEHGKKPPKPNEELIDTPQTSASSLEHIPDTKLNPHSSTEKSYDFNKKPMNQRLETSKIPELNTKKFFTGKAADLKEGILVCPACGETGLESVKVSLHDGIDSGQEFLRLVGEYFCPDCKTWVQLMFGVDDNGVVAACWDTNAIRLMSLS